jgi:HEAT repeats
MMHLRRSVWTASLAVLIVLFGTPLLHGAAPESDRLTRAKDLIGDEQWLPAIQELKAAVADPREQNRDEALFWLAQCQSEARDPAAAVGTIQQLERDFPHSAWVKPARSLRVELAQRLRRNDVLWYTAAPPPPPPPPAAPPPPEHSSAPRPARRPPSPATPQAPPAPATPQAPPLPPPPPAAWMPEGTVPDMDLRIQALGSLMHTDAVRVIPLLKEIALSGSSPDESRRALFLLAQSSRTDARATVLEVAKTGPEPVRLAAVRELGRLGGPSVPDDLMQVYATADDRVKYQVVAALGQRDAAAALMRIAQTEVNPALRASAIATLGDAGGRAQLAALYARAQAGSADAKRPILVGLFNAQADDELIRIAEQERDARAREEALAQLRLLGTPKAQAYLDSLRK